MNPSTICEFTISHLRAPIKHTLHKDQPDEPNLTTNNHTNGFRPFLLVSTVQYINNEFLFNEMSAQEHTPGICAHNWN